MNTHLFNENRMVTWIKIFSKFFYQRCYFSYFARARALSLSVREGFIKAFSSKI